MKNYTQLTKEEKTSYWQKHIDSWKASSLSQKKYCENNAVSYWNFKTWYSKLKPAIPSEAKQKKFIKIKSQEMNDAYSGKIEIIFPDKIKIIVGENIPESSLKKLFSAKGYSND
jgi:hypothetical protein